jgi:hypothetical protein
MYAEYQLNARKLERKLQRGLINRGYFKTAKWIPKLCHSIL